jgi:hypothetical protein
MDPITKDTFTNTSRLVVLVPTGEGASAGVQGRARGAPAAQYADGGATCC